MSTFSDNRLADMTEAELDAACERARVLNQRAEARFQETATAEELADRLPYIATGLRVALETRDIDGHGRMWANHLAEIASRSEMLCIKWEQERHK